jgi:FixJ family two-component response regulator
VRGVLTARQLEIARLVAEGLTNREIAHGCLSRSGPSTATWNRSGTNSESEAGLRSASG